MNYQNHYDLLISTRLKLQKERIQLRKLRYKQKIEDRTNISYFENHHIIPKCINGINDKSNLILLTAREHYIAHWLLTKIHPKETKLILALFRLSCDKQNNYISHNSKRYESNRLNYIKTVSGKNHWAYGKLGKDSPNYGYVYTDEVKQKISISTSGKNHWAYGKLGKDNPNYGSTRSISTKIKMSKSSSGKNNPMYGKHGKNNPNFGKKRSNRTKQKMRDNSGTRGLNPWDNPLTIKNELVYNWSQLDNIYDIWIFNDTPTWTVLCGLSMEFNRMIKYSQGFKNMIKWFLEHGDPRNHEEWSIFHTNYKNH